jgi:hypothetical protein
MSGPHGVKTVGFLTARHAPTALLASLLVALAGCARSAIEYAGDQVFGERDAAASDDEMRDLEADESSDQDASTEDDVTPPQSPANDASLPPAATDASQNADAARDAASDSESIVGTDASMSAPSDAQSSAPPDAGSPPPDAQSSTPDASSAPPDAAPRDTGASASCNVLSCSNDCSVAGPFRCCTERDSCGCTWAPGAYCL